MPDEKEEKTSYKVNVPADPRQRDIETFQAARRKYAPPFEVLTGPEYNGVFVRAAADLGWIKGLTADEVGGMRVPVVAQLAVPINEWISEALDMPGE